MSKRPPIGGAGDAGAADATWKGFAIVGAAIGVGALILVSFPSPKTTVSSGPGDTKATTTTTAKGGTTIPSTSTTIAARAPGDVRVLVANGTKTTGASTKVKDALKPACYKLLTPIDATKAIKDAAPPQTRIYSTDDFAKEADVLRAQLNLPATSVSKLPAVSPVAVSTATFDLLLVVGQDFVDKAPSALPSTTTCSTGATTGGSSTTTTKKTTGSTTAGSSTTSTTRRSTSSTTSTTRGATSTTGRPTTTVP